MQQKEDEQKQQQPSTQRREPTILEYSASSSVANSSGSGGVYLSALAPTAVTSHLPSPPLHTIGKLKVPALVSKKSPSTNAQKTTIHTEEEDHDSIQNTATSTTATPNISSALLTTDPGERLAARAEAEEAAAQYGWDEEEDEEDEDTMYIPHNQTPYESAEQKVIQQEVPSKERKESDETPTTPEDQYHSVRDDDYDEHQNENEPLQRSAALTALPISVNTQRQSFVEADESTTTVNEMCVPIVEVRTQDLEFSKEQHQQQSSSLFVGDVYETDQTDRNVDEEEEDTEIKIVESKQVPAAEKLEIMDRDMDDNPDDYASNTPDASFHESSHEDALAASPPLTPAAASTQTTSRDSDRNRLLMLVSSESIDRRVKARQELAATALTAAGIEFETMDGADEAHRALRDELFVVSGLRGEYPQFFLVNLSNGGTMFWGNWEHFQNTNDDGRLKEEFGSSAKVVQTPITPVTPVIMHQPKTDVIPEEILENFSNQIKRIEENYQAERVEMEQRHARELQEAGASHEQCEAAQKELEDRFLAEIRTKDDQIHELCRRNEGLKLKLDVLKREVTGTQELLAAKKSDIGTANEKYLRELRAMEKKMVEAENNAIGFQQERQRLQESLAATKQELHLSIQEHNELKERVKLVATELKDRRAECRNLHAKIDELNELNEQLQTTLHSLQEKLTHQSMNQTEKDIELQQLRVQLANASREIENVEKIWKEREAKNDQALAEYKKKAQNALSMANSRTAAAVQAREEAELDARAARAIADSAFERATKAEIASREATAEARASVEEMKKERNDAYNQLQSTKERLVQVEIQLAETQQNLMKLESEKNKKEVELNRTLNLLENEQAKVASSEQMLIDSEHNKETLRRDVANLREQLQNTKFSLELAEKRQSVSDPVEKVDIENIDNPGDAATVAALQQDLNDANAAIDDLKEALKNALADKHQDGNASFASLSRDNSETHGTESFVGGNHETIPLFYAMEKQAELKAARDEMNRLASVLADVELEKTEAIEAMENMRRRMEDAEARLKRFEKLGSTSRHIGAAIGEQYDGGATNIEYLKHVIIKFFNAKSVNEKKGLVPVIGAVLELTPDELKAATENVQKGSSVTSIFGLS
jgi:hypothetical protein